MLEILGATLTRLVPAKASIIKTRHFRY